MISAVSGLLLMTFTANSQDQDWRNAPLNPNSNYHEIVAKQRAENDKIKDKKTSNVVHEVNVVGRYVIDVTVNEKSKQVVGDSGADANKIVVYYRVNNHKKEIEISSFTEETIRRR